MNSFTVTQPTTYVLTLKGGNIKIDPEKVLVNLSEIIDAHRNWKDLVSAKINEWAGNAMTLISTDGLATPESLLQKVQSDINVLFNEILVSSTLRRMPLTEPLLMDEKYTWEKRELQEFCTTFPITPWGKPLADIVIKPHAFALAMLKWARELPFEPVADANQPMPPFSNQTMIQPHTQTQAQSIVPINPKTGGVDLKAANQLLRFYIQAGQIAQGELHSYNLCNVIKKATQDAKTSRAEIEEFVRLAEARAKRKAEQQKAEVLGCIDDMKKSHDSKVDIMKSRIEDAQTETRATFEKLTYSEQQCALHAARIDALSAAYAAKCQEVADMQKDRGGGCTLF